MTAAVLREPNNIVLQDVPIPQIGPSDVLIKVRFCGICGSDLHSFTSGMFVDPGQIMGHEFSGEIAEVGESVLDLRRGDRVTGFSAGVCGECASCERGEAILCAELFKNSTGYGLAGAFAEYVKIERAVVGESVHKLDDTINNIQGAMVEPIAVGVSAVTQAKVKPNDKVVVLGAGMIGNACLQAAKAVGASEVIVVEVSDTRLRLAKDCGADDVFDARTGDALRWVMDKFGEAPYHFQIGGNADVVLEAAGHPTTIKQAFEMVRPGGTICFVGLPEGEVPIDTTKIVHKMPQIVGSLGGDFVAAIDAINAGKIRPEPLVTHRFALGDIATAFQQQLNADETVKVMIEVA